MNKCCCLGNIVHAECVDPQPMHCRYSSHLIQHAPHIDGTKQDLLGELLQRIGTEQRAAACAQIQTSEFNFTKLFE